MWEFYRNHQGKILLWSVVLAFILGIYEPHIFKHLIFISNTFINLLKMCALPVVLTSLVLAIGNLQQIHELKQVARNSILYILLTEVVAVTIGIVVFNYIDISANINPHTLLSNAKYEATSSSGFNIEFITNYIFSANIFKSLVNFDILPIVAFSIMFGITCAFNQKKARPILDFMQSLRDIFIALLNAIMCIAPFAIFVLVGDSVANSYINGELTSNLLGLMRFVGLFLFALFIHFLWQLALVVMLYRNLKLSNVLITSSPIFTTAFITSSSLATLPTALEKSIELGGKKKVVNFMLPICASMNFSSGMMYEMVACLFFMKILGIHPDLSHQILLAIACILTGIAVGGIPETSMVSFITVFGMANIPLSAIAVLMPLDRILDRIRGMVNIFGNTCGTLIVSKSINDNNT